MATSLRFTEVSQEDLELLLENSVPEKTKRATKYGMKIFNGNKRILIMIQINDIYLTVSMR